MIVTPDFLDHYKTLMLAELLEDPMAHAYVLRLWGHCQIAKRWRFERMSAPMLKGVCRFPGDAGRLFGAMQEAGFIEMDGETLVAHQWAERNASLIMSWENGAKGGRPPKPKKNPRDTHGIPMANPALTHGEPGANRLDRIGEDKTNTLPGLEPGVAPRPRNLLLDALVRFAEQTDPLQATNGVWGKASSALKDIKAVTPSVTPAEIERRAGNYRAHFSDASISCTALAKHWGRCDRSPTPASAPAEYRPAANQREESHG